MIDIIIDIAKNNFIPCLVNMVTIIYILTKLLKDNSIFSNKRTYAVILLMVIFAIINFKCVDNFIRIIISTLYIIVCAKVVFEKKLYKIISAAIITQVIIFVSELIYVLIIMSLSQIDSLTLFESTVGSFMATFLICLISVILINLKPILNLCNIIIEYIDKIKKKNKYILMFLFMATLNVLLFIMYLNSHNLTLVIINIIFMVFYSYIIYLLLSEKNHSIKIKEENEMLLQNLNEYEKMLDYQRVANHENKNQLLVIKSIASKNNKKLHSYLDEIIKEKREDDEALYNSAKRIPSGGLQGLIYQKMLVMKENGINLELNISKETRKIDLSVLGSKINYDICNIIGVIVDNAIDEVIKLEDKEISIVMYKDEGQFVIEVVNRCKDIPDLTKIDEYGYTSKNKGHGYGLSLLKEICNKNDSLTNERKIIKDMFFQIIKIKL